MVFGPAWFAGTPESLESGIIIFYGSKHIVVKPRLARGLPNPVSVLDAIIRKYLGFF